MTDQKKLTDHLPLDIYEFDQFKVEADDSETLEVVKFIKLDDLETILQKLARPEVINKVMKSLMFGKKLELKDLLNEAIK